MTEYGFALAGMLALAVWSGRREIVMSAFVIVGVWAAWCLFILVTKDYEPWYWGIAIDGAAIALLARRKSIPPPCETRALLVALFITQVFMHLAYGAVKWRYGSADWEAYYTQTQVVAWAQLLVVGGWGGGISLRRIWLSRYRDQLLGHRPHYRDIGAGK